MFEGPLPKMEVSSRPMREKLRSLPPTIMESDARRVLEVQVFFVGNPVLPKLGVLYLWFLGCRCFVWFRLHMDT